MTQPKIKKYTNKDMKMDLAILSSKILDYIEKVGPIELIIGVSRGGLIPAVYLSHSLNIPLKTVECSTRDGMTGESSIEWLSRISNAIIVDDLADSGKTLNILKSVNPDLMTAVLIQKEMSDHTADFFGSRTSTLDWIEFDWESKSRY